jgi:ferredoxin-type protein NapH
MKVIQNIGLGILLFALTIFTSVIFLGDYTVSQKEFDKWISSKGIKSEIVIEEGKQEIVGKTFTSQFSLSSAILDLAEKSHVLHRENITRWEKEGVSKEKIDAEWGKVIWLKWFKSHGQLTYDLVKVSINSPVQKNQGLFLFLTFGLASVGALMFMLPNVILLGPEGIKNDGVMHSSATNRGWIGIVAFAYLVSFYVVLYFYPDFLVNQILIVDPISRLLSGGPASQWFLYGMLYCTVMTLMAVRMFIKYRHNKYQILRTASVLFFQIVFAFLIPELLVRFNMPWYDFKNAWPLDYDFFYAWSLDELRTKGVIGIFILVWGILLTVVIVPVFVYFFGKRWYCSWVCGCGGLAETLGDPYRQLSDKSVKFWKVERWLIHSIFVFATVMTIATLYTYFTKLETLFGLVKTGDLQVWYGFLIGSIFAGVIGTGFYPVMGNRVWCRMGCPLAAYMGIVQRFKSRFRITTNGAQCISCGNCSTYCEQGIDVRWYAQRNQNIVRASCVGCGVCSAVCPRGVLKLENGPEEDRFKISEMPSIKKED